MIDVNTSTDTANEGIEHVRGLAAYNCLQKFFSILT